MYKRKNYFLRVISFVLAFSIVLPMIPISSFNELIPIVKEVRAAEITGTTHEYTITSNYNVLSRIQSYLQEASQNPNDLYIITLNNTRTTTISSV